MYLKPAPRCAKRVTVLGMDISGVVVDKGKSKKFRNGGRIMGIGTVGWSDGGSFQTHVLVD